MTNYLETASSKPPRKSLEERLRGGGRRMHARCSRCGSHVRTVNGKHTGTGAVKELIEFVSHF